MSRVKARRGRAVRMARKKGKVKVYIVGLERSLSMWYGVIGVVLVDLAWKRSSLAEQRLVWPGQMSMTAAIL